MKNDLFNQTLLKKYAQKFKPTHKQKETIREYIKKVEKGVFKAETKNYIKFYDMILKEILGYDIDNVLFDEKVEYGIGRSEFVLKSNDKKFMVVELKGQDVNLDKKLSRTDRRSPVDQAFGYAIHTGDIEWIFLSNYKEFRLYNYHEKIKFISFNASELLDEDKFRYFMVTFSNKSIDADYIGKIREETLVIEKKLAAEFYKLFNETRLMLINELEDINDFDRKKAIHYAQLILNRYMFICFAEDMGLLPSQISINTISRPIIGRDIGRNEIWHRINALFIDVNKGNEFKGVFGYNGGLFEEDLKFICFRDIVKDKTSFKDVNQEWKFEEYKKNISHLIEPYGDIINPIYRNLLTISSFDFLTELDVNILGHIFENSIGDIEELMEDTKGRRKKEGIFYTPEYITDYICRNTILPYLSKSGDANTVKKLLKEFFGRREIEELDKKVKEIKIVDPACGSGAFLNKASDVLLEIHEAIHKEKYSEGTLDKYFDPIEERRKILLDNIYGWI